MEAERIWIYLSNKAFDEQQQSKISNMLTEFCGQWQSHGRKLEANWEIRFHQVIIVKVNQKVFDASGCSIDKLVHCIQDIEKQLMISLFDRMLVGYVEGENQLKTVHLSEIKTLTDDAKVLDNTIQFVSELETAWILPLSESKYSVLR